MNEPLEASQSAQPLAVSALNQAVSCRFGTMLKPLTPSGFQKARLSICWKRTSTLAMVSGATAAAVPATAARLLDRASCSGEVTRAVGSAMT